jgi:hypothetical protein
MNVEIGAEAEQFPGKEYINGIAVAVYDDKQRQTAGTRKDIVLNLESVVCPVIFL